MKRKRVKITIFSTDIWTRKVDVQVLFFVSKMGEQMHKLNFYVNVESIFLICMNRIYLHQVENISICLFVQFLS